MMEDHKTRENLATGGSKDIYYALRKRRLQDEFLKRGIISKSFVAAKGAELLSETAPRAAVYGETKDLIEEGILDRFRGWRYRGRSYMDIAKKEEQFVDKLMRERGIAGDTRIVRLDREKRESWQHKFETARRHYREIRLTQKKAVIAARAARSAAATVTRTAVRVAVSLLRSILLNPYVLGIIAIFLIIFSLIMFISTLAGASYLRNASINSYEGEQMVFKTPTVGELSRNETVELPLTLPTIRDLTGN